MPNDPETNDWSALEYEQLHIEISKPEGHRYKLVIEVRLSPTQAQIVDEFNLYDYEIKPNHELPGLKVHSLFEAPGIPKHKTYDYTNDGIGNIDWSPYRSHVLRAYETFKWELMRKYREKLKAQSASDRPRDPNSPPIDKDELADSVLRNRHDC